MRRDHDSEGLQVMVRVRPPISTEVKLNTVVTASGGVSVSVANDKTQVQCAYDRVFNENCEQSDVFETMKPLLNDILQGINGTVFAYGQTSAGKSHTMLGPNGGADILKTPKSKWGLLPRSAEYLLTTLSAKEAAGELSYNVKASFLQIYNETVYDLLSGSDLDRRFKEEERQEKEQKTGNGQNTKSSFYDAGGLKIREVPRPAGDAPLFGTSAPPQEVYVSGLSEFRVTTAEDVLHLVAAGTSNRAMRSTDFNATSSRSHAVLQLSFEIEQHGKSGETVISRSKLSMADLAGSEKILTHIEHPVGTEIKENEYVKTRHLRELTSINTSLSCLGNVIAALTNKSRSHIPYRDSKLTRLLQDSLGGNTRTILMACVAPTDMHTSESLSTLQFADRAKGVMLKVKANMVVDDKAALGRANAEITRLQNLLANALAKLEGKGSKSPMKSGDVSENIPSSGNEAFINGDESSIDFYIKENARLREELFELRTMFGQGQASKINQKKMYTSHVDNKNAISKSNKSGKSSGLQLNGEETGTTDEQRSKESDLYRANRKQRRRRNRKNQNDNENEEEKDSSRLVSRFRQASIQDSHALSSSGSTKIYGSSTSLKTLRKTRASFEDKEDLGETNREYFNGFLSSLDSAANQDVRLKNENDEALNRNKTNIYVKHHPKGNSKSANRRGGSGNKSKSNDSNKASSTSPARMRIEAERVVLEKAYMTAQSELKSEIGVLDDLAAQRRSLERQLNEVGMNQSVDSNDHPSSCDSFADDEENKNNESQDSFKIKIDAIDISDDQYDSQDFQPLSLDDNNLDQVDIKSELAPTTSIRSTDDKENNSNEQAHQQSNARRGLSEILSPKRASKGGAHATHLRDNIHQASAAQALPSPLKMNTHDVGYADLNAPSPAVAHVPIKERQISSDGLSYCSKDIGREIQQFSFRHSDWVDLRIDGFDENTGTHRVTSLTDGQSQFIDLRKKPVRVLV